MKKKVKKKEIVIKKPTRAEQRVAIAKDVILQLKVGNLIADRGIYLDPAESVECQVGASLKNLLIRKKPVCRVCGIGGMFISTVRKFNSYDIPACELDNQQARTSEWTGTSQSDMRKVLRRYFPPSQISLIECAFEESTNFKDGADNTDNWGARSNARIFGYKFDEDDERLTEICKNIIKNKGTFKP